MNMTDNYARVHLHTEIFQKAQCLFPHESPIPFGMVWDKRGSMMAAYAIMLMQKAPDAEAKEVYATVASEFGCTISAVMNCIRYVIVMLWHKDREAFCAYAGTELKERPTVAEFLDLLLAKQRVCQKQNPEEISEAAETTRSVEDAEPASTAETAEDVDAKAVREQSQKDNAERLGT